MTIAGRASVVLLAIAVIAGTIADRPATPPSIALGGYRVMAADFHLHSSMWSDGALTPWGLVLEARRQGLDAIAVTGHNETWDGRVARWFARAAGGPIVLTGQEIHTLGHHVIAVGITRVVPFLDDVPAQIDAIHAQGGIAIAAHPTRAFSPGFDEAALAHLDGAEICHPLVYVNSRFQREFELFAARAPLAAIGSSDFHGLGAHGPVPDLRVRARGDVGGRIEALRAHRTVGLRPGWPRVWRPGARATRRGRARSPRSGDSRQSCECTRVDQPRVRRGRIDRARVRRDPTRGSIVSGVSGFLTSGPSTPSSRGRLRPAPPR